MLKTSEGQVFACQGETKSFRLSPFSTLMCFTALPPLTWISCSASELLRFLLCFSSFCSAGLGLKKSSTVFGALHKDETDITGSLRQDWQKEYTVWHI